MEERWRRDGGEMEERLGRNAKVILISSEYTDGSRPARQQARTN